MSRVLVALLAFFLATFVAVRAHAEPARILITAGSNRGLAAERPLKFAGNDAQRVRDVMVSLGGVEGAHAFLLKDPTRAALYAAIEQAKAEAKRHRADEVTLVFYFSGHGDRAGIHLDGERVPIAELSAKLGEVPAGLRIAVTDACRATREKGFAADEPFAISTTLIPQASGQVWLHASSDGEAAQESDELQGAIFTHAWLNGLRGAADANGDANVTLDESFSFAHAQTLIRSAKSSGVVQKPEAVVNLHEHAPVVITQTTAHLATVSLPKAADTHFLIYSAGGKSVVSELWGAPDRRLVLRVPPGRYIVHRRLGSVAGAAQIAVAEGEQRTLDDRDFSAAALDALAQKGEGAPEPDRVAPPPPAGGHELSAGYDLGASARTGFVHGPRATWAYGWRGVALYLGGGVDFTGRILPDKSERLTGGYLRAGLELRLPLGALTLRAGGGARAGVVWQAITLGAGETPEDKSAFALGPELFVGARVGFGAWFVDVTGTGGLAFLREEDALRGVSSITGTVSLGVRF